jgi:drug/metabolite transporter (DMT)-like permease
VIASTAYILLYRALELGPVALVSPIVAAYAVVTIPLAIVVLHESPSGVALAGACVTVAGVILTGTDLRQAASGRRMSTAGVPAAFASMLLFGVATFIVGRSSQHVGWLFTITLSRASTAVFLAASAVWRPPDLRRVDAPGIAGAIGVGLVDLVGMVMYSRGSELGLVSIVTAASATFPLLAVLGGIVLLHERPAATQLLGVALVIVGLLVLGTG